MASVQSNSNPCIKVVLIHQNTDKTEQFDLSLTHTSLDPPSKKNNKKTKQTGLDPIKYVHVHTHACTHTHTHKIIYM